MFNASDMNKSSKMFVRGERPFLKRIAKMVSRETGQRVSEWELVEDIQRWALALIETPKYRKRFIDWIAGSSGGDTREEVVDSHDGRRNIQENTMDRDRITIEEMNLVNSLVTRISTVEQELAADELTEAEGGFTLNVASVAVADARRYAMEILEAKGKNLDELIPDFDENYLALQRKTLNALNIPRILMPVIEPPDMKLFHEKLAKGHLDVFSPYAKGQLAKNAPSRMTKQEGEEWVTLGIQDGDKTDDVVKGKWTTKQAKRLLPTQSQIWLEKLIGNIAKFGVPSSSSPIAKQTIIVSKEGYILDGHHRFGQAMLAAPKLKLKALYVPLRIDTLLSIGRSYGAAIGNEPKG